MPRRKALAMLAYLAVTGVQQSRDALAALLWPEQDASDALANLRRTLGVLKASVGEGVLAIDRSQIGLLPDADLQVDVVKFRSLLEIARADGHFERRDTLPDRCPSCVDAITEAVALYRGDFMAGFHLSDSLAFDDWQFDQDQQLRSDYAAALTLLSHWQAQAGEFQTAIETVRRLLALDRLHEPAHRLLMQLYARSGQTAAAIRHFDDLTRILDEELAVEPEPETVDLLEAIKNRRIQPEVDRDVIPPVAAGEPPQVEPDGGARVTFPRALSRLIGRDDEVQKVLDLLIRPDVQLVTVSGFGGMGKTHLALTVGERIMREHSDDFPDGAVFVDLADVDQIDEFPGELAESLQLPLFGSPDPLDEVCRYLKEKRMLLVLDNFEQLAEEASVLSRLLAGAPQVKLLVTSREPLALAAEYRFNLEGLTYPDLTLEGDSALERFDEYGSVQLFLHAARQISTGLLLDETARPCILRLCWLVSGMPLAINLAAGWLRIMSCEEIVRELEQNLDLLNTTLRDLPERQRSIRVIIESTWEMLTPDEQQALRSIAVFSGGFTVQAVREITGATPALLAGLVDRGLVQFVSGRRYVMHQLVRQFAEEMLDRSGQGEAVAEIHSRYYLYLVVAQQEKLNGQGAVEAIETIREDLANIRQAWVWAALNERVEILMACYPVLAAFFEYVGLLAEGENLFERTATLLSGSVGSEARRLRLLLILRQYQFALDRGKTQGFQSLLEPVTEEIESLGDASLTAELNFVRGYSYQLVGQFDRAIECYQPAIETFQVQNRKRKLIDMYNWLGEVHNRIHMPEAAADEHWRALELAEELGDQRRQALSLSFIGGYHWYRDEFLEAREYFYRALDLFEQIGDRLGICRTLNNVGYINNFLGNYAEAEEKIRRSIRVFEQTGAHATAAQAYDSLAETLFALGDYPAARQAFQKAYDLMSANEQKYDEAFALANLGRLDAAEGDFDPAVERLREAIRMLEETGVQKEAAVLYGILGGVYRQKGDLIQAKECIDRAVVALKTVSGPYWLAGAYLEKAELLIDLKQFDEVETLVDAAEPMAARAGGRPVLARAARIRARWLAATGRADAAVETLRAAHSLASTDFERAAADYLLWELTGDSESAQNAWEVYARLGEKIRGGEVITRLESLRAAIQP